MRPRDLRSLCVGGRLIGCRSCGASALFLASDDASFMIGAYLVVDGGIDPAVYSSGEFTGTQAKLSKRGALQRWAHFQ